MIQNHQLAQLNAELRALREKDVEQRRLLKDAHTRLLMVARMAEALKRPCSMDVPDSPQAIRNGEYMNISYTAREPLEAIKNYLKETP